MKDGILEQLGETQKQASRVIMEVEKMKEQITDDVKQEPENFENTLVPWGMVELVMCRADTEKEKMRKHYHKIIAWICAVFLAFVIAVFGFGLYIIQSCDFMSYNQDVETGIANYIGNDGDIVNGETDYPFGTTEK